MLLGESLRVASGVNSSLLAALLVHGQRGASQSSQGWQTTSHTSSSTGASRPAWAPALSASREGAGTCPRAATGPGACGAPVRPLCPALSAQ